MMIRGRKTLLLYEKMGDEKLSQVKMLAKR